MINYTQLQGLRESTGNLIFDFEFYNFGPGRVHPGREFSVILRCAHSEFPGPFGHPLADWSGFFFSGLKPSVSIFPP